MAEPEILQKEPKKQLKKNTTVVMITIIVALAVIIVIGLLTHFLEINGIWIILIATIAAAVIILLGKKKTGSKKEIQKLIDICVDYYYKHNSITLMKDTMDKNMKMVKNNIVRYLGNNAYIYFKKENLLFTYDIIEEKIIEVDHTEVDDMFKDVTKHKLIAKLLEEDIKKAEILKRIREEDYAI
jgi:Mn2+/Fe2+ NRAMP family transporter